MKSENYLLTIAIPVFNRFDYFIESLNSALVQGSGVEVIVVDNCSSHNKFELECLRHGSRVKYYRNDLNIGMYGNWNRCFELAKGEYVMILGDDDVLMKDYFDRFKKVITIYEPDIYFTNFKILDERRASLLKNNFTFSVKCKTLLENAKYTALYGIGFPTITMSIKKSVFTSYFDGFTASNDWLWIYTCTEGLKFYGLNDELVIYRKHPLSDTSSSEDLFKYQIGIAAIYHMISTYLALNHSFFFNFALARAVKLLNKLRFNEVNYISSRDVYIATSNSPYRHSILTLEGTTQKSGLVFKLAYAFVTIIDVLVSVRGRIYYIFKKK